MKMKRWNSTIYLYLHISPHIQILVELKIQLEQIFAFKILLTLFNLVKIGSRLCAKGYSIILSWSRRQQPNNDFVKEPKNISPIKAILNLVKSVTFIYN